MEFFLLGLRANFVIPADYVRHPASYEPIQEAPSVNIPVETGVVPSDVLLVNDNLIIALDAEDMLHKIGVKTVRVASGVTDALLLIEQHHPVLLCSTSTWVRRPVLTSPKCS